MPTLEYLLGIQAVTRRRLRRRHRRSAAAHRGRRQDLEGGRLRTQGRPPRACTSRARPRAGRCRTTTSPSPARCSTRPTAARPGRRRPRRPGTLLYAVDSVGQDVWVAGGDPSAGPVLGGERVSGDGVLLHSPDGGATWETQWGGGAADLRLNDVDMLDEPDRLGGRRRDRRPARARPAHHRRRRHLDRAGPRRHHLRPRRRPRARRADRLGRRRRRADPAHHRRRRHLDDDPRRRGRPGHARARRGDGEARARASAFPTRSRTT